MAKEYTSSVGIKFQRSTLSLIDELAEEQGVSRAEIVRSACSLGLPLVSRGVSPDFKRLLVIGELLQIGMTALLEKEGEGLVEEAINRATENVERFHG